MTKPRDPEALLSAYLAEGMEVLPDRVADAVLDEIHRTRQRAVFGPWTTRTIFKPSLALAAVVAVLVAGTLLATRRDQPTIGDPSASLPGAAAPSSTPSATAPNSSALPRTTGVWITTGSMGTPRDDHTAVRLLDGRVLVTGGSDVQNDTSAEVYDPDSGTWSATGNMVHPHSGFPPTLLRDGKVLVGDVLDENTDDEISGISGAELYDPATGTWSSTGTLVTTEEWLAGTTATLLANGKVLVTGFHGSELYDPASDTWTAAGKMITPRYNHTATLLPDGRVLVAGGDVPPDRATDSAELYDPDTGTWTATASLRATGNTRFDIITATALQDGTVLVVRPSSAELYDPAAETWTATHQQPRPGTAFRSATLLSDGKVLVTDVPGGDHDSPSYAELYDPVTGSWTTTAPLLRSHRTPPILLLDGTVLVAGGSDCLDRVCVTRGSAELYVPAGVSPPPLPAFPSPPPPVFPSPTPIPTPLPPAAGPVPAGARSWTVRVTNDSSEPATFFEAEEDETGVGRLCGSVTPNVVPPHATVMVTFLLPPKRVTTCWIWVSPSGGGGSFFQTSDAPMEGEFLIQEGGQPGWLGP